jgi:hypothetical protein
MSLDIYLFRHKEESKDNSIDNRQRELYWGNITHNLGTMAKEAGIYQALWRPEEINAVQAKDITDIVAKGLQDLVARPDYYEKFNSPNGWGTYDNFVIFVTKYLIALNRYPESYIYISR